MALREELRIQGSACVFFGIIVCIFVRCDVIRLSHKLNSAFIRIKNVEYV